MTVVTYSALLAHTTRHALFAPSELIVVTVVTYSAKFSRCFVQARHLKILPNACLVVCTQKCPFAAAYRLLQKDESTLSYFFVVPPFFPESSHLQAQQDTKANALISLCGNGHNTVQTYLLLFFQSDAPRCIHDKRCSAPLTSRQLSVSSFLSLLLLFFAFMNLSYQRMMGLSSTFYLEFSHFFPQTHLTYPQI